MTTQIDTSIFSPIVRNFTTALPDYCYHEERDDEGRYVPGSGCGLVNLHIPGVWDLVIERLGPQRAQEAIQVKCVCDDTAKARAVSAFIWSKLPGSSPQRPPRTFQNFAPRPGTDEAYEAAYAMTDKHAAPPPTLVLASISPGTGKSHLAEAICRVYLAAQKTVRYERVPQLMRLLQPPDTGQPDQRDGVRRDAIHAGMLWLDELGGEKPSAFTEQELLNIIDARMVNGKPTIVTTNKMKPWFDSAEVGYARIGSRLFGEHTGETKVVVIPATVTDYRALGGVSV